MHIHITITIYIYIYIYIHIKDYGRSTENLKLRGRYPEGRKHPLKHEQLEN